ncbi:MAG: hypothetical protein R3B54_09810 [Bdellovibrionota bacterium]
MRNYLYIFYILLIGPSLLEAAALVQMHSDLLCRTSVFIESQKPGYELLQGLFASANPRGISQSEDEIEADNRFFLEVIQAPQAKHFIFLHGTLKPLKVLNDRVFAGEGIGGKQDVNAARNLFRILLLERFDLNPIVKKCVVARYANSIELSGQFTDFKTLEIALDPGRAPDAAQLIEEMNHEVRMAQIEFEAAMLILTRDNPEIINRLLKEKGLVSDLRHWHTFGWSFGNPDLAGAMARLVSRDFHSDRANSITPRSFSERDLQRAVARVEGGEGKLGLRRELIARLGASSPVFQKYEDTDHPVLSLLAIDILRSSTARNREEYVAERQRQFKEILKVELDEKAVILLRDYFSEADIFIPSIRQAKRGAINLSKARFGFHGIDYARQNVFNVYHTLGALAIAADRGVEGSGRRAVELSRAGEVLATARLTKLQMAYDKVCDAAGVEGERQKSGDDGAVIPGEHPSSAQFLRLYRGLADVEGVMPFDLRPTYVWPVKSEKTKELDIARMSTSGVNAEKVEKTVRGHLIGKLSEQAYQKLLIPVHIDPESHRVEIYVAGGDDDSYLAVENALSEPSVMPEGFHLFRIINLN